MIFNLFNKSDSNQKTFDSVAITEDMKIAAKEYIEKLLTLANFNPVVAINNDSEDIIYVMIEDEEDTARIIGKDGQTLISLRTLLQSYVSRKFDQPVPVFVDCNEYFSLRVEKAQAKAKELEKKLNDDRSSIELFPMSAIERRAIHTMYKDNQSVKTYSIGEGDDRRIVLALK